MKLGIVIDSSSGITKKEASKKGWHFLPLFLNINDKEYADGINITPKKYFEMIDITMETKTSATPVGIILDTINHIKEKYDFIIIYPLSNELSSQANNIKTFVKDYKNIYVVNSKGVGYAIVEELELLEKIAKQGKTRKELIAQIEFWTKKQTGVVVPKTMDWLVKGGRIPSSLAAMSSLLKIIPIILLKDGKLHKFGKGRLFQKAIIKASKMLQKQIKNKKGKFILYVARAIDQELIVSEIKKHLNIKKLDIRKFPPIIVNHIGPNSIGLVYVSQEII